MSKRRVLILVAAVVIGGLAAFSLANYVRGVEDDLNEDARMVEVFKIVEPIPKGTFGDEAFRQGMIEQSEINIAFRPANSVTDPVQIDGKVAIADLAENQVLVDNQFVSQAESLSTFSSLLEENQVAITVSVDAVRGVANLLVPGDFVNILVSKDVFDDAAPEEALVGEDGEPVVASEGDGLVQPDSRYLYQKVQILAVGQQRQLQPGETTGTNPDGSPIVQQTGLITFAVPVEAAQWIAAAGNEIQLALVAKDYQAIPVGPIQPSPTLPGENPDQQTPYGPGGPEA